MQFGVPVTAKSQSPHNSYQVRRNKTVFFMVEFQAGFLKTEFFQTSLTSSHRLLCNIIKCVSHRMSQNLHKCS